MIVLCPQCQSRYQLADERIRPKGTKVRCPRCQHTFRVFSESTREARSEAVEPPPFSANPSTHATESIVNEFAQPTNAWATQSSAEETQAARMRAPSPFDGPTRIAPELPEDLSKASTVKRGQPTATAKQPSPFKKAPEKLPEPPVAEVESDFFSDFEATVAAEKTPSTFISHAPAYDEGEATEFVHRSDVNFEVEATDPTPMIPMPPQRRVEEIEPEVKASAKTARPFGDETFLEIQKMSRPKSKLPKKIAIAAAVVLVLVGGFFVSNHVPMPDFSRHPTLTPEDASTTHDAGSDTTKNPSEPTKGSKSIDARSFHEDVRRPQGWYREEPATIQDALSQLAILPPGEQLRPANRSLTAEALILNGILTGSSDQLSTGLGYASGLMVADPTSIYGFYGLTTYSLWKEDPTALGDLIKRWPEVRRLDPEFRLAQAVVRARVDQNLRAGLDLLRTLLADVSEYQLAQAWTYLLSLESKQNEAEEILGPTLIQNAKSAYIKHRDLIRSSSQNMPALYQSIEKRARMAARTPKKGTAENSMADTLNQRSAQKFQDQKNTKNTPASTVAPAPISGASPTRPAVSPAPLATPAPVFQPVLPNQSQPQAPISAPPQSIDPATSAVSSVPEVHSKHEKGSKNSKKLPKASQGLIAANKEVQTANGRAAELLKLGIQREKENKTDDAVKLFQQALQFNPDLAEIYKRLGVIYMGRKENERALRSFKLYLQLRPDSDDKQMVQSWINSLQ